GALAMVTKKDETFSFIRSWGLDIDPSQEYRIEDCWGLRRGQPHMVETNQGGLLCHHVEGAKDMFSERTLLCIPLGAHSGSEGFLHLRRETSLEERKLRGEEGISLATQQLALTVGEQVGLALANLALQESLRIQAIRDPITGLFNRRYMEESLVREIQRSIRNGSNLGVIMLDIDHFKVFNDRFGHAVGDALLRELGTFLQERVRKEDIACKYGGEEFVLIMPNADLSITADRAELIRREVKDVHVEEDGKTFDNITLSLGVSVFPMHGRDGDAVLKVADTALYQAKAKGRDQVVVGTSGKKNSGKDRRN
ncbi:MAG: GGDEF domain-containing protein, partial [Anaerolineae bacterium]|nr:GGDEF domain-containing protein [Anaerolineae bacterium]